MNLGQVRDEIKELGKSPVAEKTYPITSDWVPITDVLAILNRFEKHWKNYMEKNKDAKETEILSEILGKK